MSGKDDKPVVTKKVGAYPIAVDLVKVEGQPPLKGQIWKLTEVGFIMKVEMNFYYKVGDEYETKFVLPVLAHEIKARVKVIKTYDVLEQLTRDSKVKLLSVEMHFVHLEETNRRWIHGYLDRIGQRR